jgi:hypothetical protein
MYRTTASASFERNDVRITSFVGGRTTSFITFAATWHFS